MNGAAVTRVLRGPAAFRLLSRFGIDPKRYWLLLDLFRELAERRELMSHLGRDGVTLTAAAWLYFGLSAFMSIIAVVAGAPLDPYFGGSIGLTAFLLLSVLISETSNSLVNPVEGLVLAHQPINGATYTAAKLTHLLRILLYLVPGLSVAPAFIALGLDDTPWFYPIAHIAAAFGAGSAAALLCCAVFGWLIRFVPPPRLKSAGQVAEMLPLLALSTMQLGQVSFKGVLAGHWLPADFAFRWYMGAALALAAVAAVVLGIRALSGDYLVRVAAIAHGRGVAGRKDSRSRMGDLVAWLFGGPGSRAGYTYVSCMMRRDWSFRRQLIPMIPSTFLMAAWILSGVRTSPFSGRFTALHVAPHTCGFLLFMICSVLAHGSDRKGTWIFLLAPTSVFAPFVRGVYGFLWVTIVLAPNLVLLPVLGWFWGIAQAGLFGAYSIAVGSFYLGLELRLIDGLPFSKEVETSRGMVLLPIMIAGGLGIAIAVALQYFVLFRSMTMVMVATAAMAAGAYFLTRSSLASFEQTIRFNLGLLSAESKALYREVE